MKKEKKIYEYNRNDRNNRTKWWKRQNVWWRKIIEESWWERHNREEKELKKNKVMRKILEVIIELSDEKDIIQSGNVMIDDDNENIDNDMMIGSGEMIHNEEE